MIEDPLFYQKHMFSDRGNYWINGYEIKKQKCRLWSEDQPEELRTVYGLMETLD